MKLDIKINSRPHQVESSISLQALIMQFVDTQQGIAVAVNQNVIPRSLWASTTIKQADSIDIFQAIAGG